MTSHANRERYVAQILAHWRLEGIELDAADQLLLQEYIAGRSDLDPLLAYVNKLAKAVQKNEICRNKYDKQ